MNWPHEQFLFLLSLIAVGLCISIDDQRLEATLSENDIWRSLLDVYKDEELTAQSFPYVVYTKTKKPCILANMTIRIALPTEQANENKTIDVPFDVKVEGNCSRVISNMEISWPAKEEKVEPNRVSFTFLNDHTKFTIFSIHVDIHIPGTSPDNDKGKRFTENSDVNLGLFPAPAANGIHTCNRETRRPVGKGEIIMKNVSLIAFNTTDDISSRSEEKCAADDGKSTLKTFPLVLKNDKTNVVCILAKMSISLEVPYKTTTSQNKVAVIEVPRDVGVSGYCDNVKSRMNLNWTESSEKPAVASSEKENVIKLELIKDGAQSYLRAMKIDIFLDEKNFPDAGSDRKRVVSATDFDDSWFHAAAENGLYSCPNTTTLKLGEANVKITDVLLVAAFNAQKDLSSKEVTECPFEPPSTGFDYVVDNKKTGVPCILANMSIIVAVSSKDGEGVKNTTVPVSNKEVKVNGICGEAYSTMNLTWPNSSEKQANTLKFHIGRNKSDFFVYGIEAGILHEKQFLTGSTDFDMHLFSGPVNNGLYNCTNRTQEIQAGNIYLNISKVVLVAFNTAGNISTKEVRSCPDGSDTEHTSTTLVTSSTTEPTSSTTTTIQPDPSTKKYNYVVTNPETLVSCIAANMSIFIKIPYQAKDAKMKEAVLQVPKTATASGKCENPSSSMDLIWTEENSKEENAVTLTFKGTGSKYSLRSIKLNISLDEKHFPDALGDKYVSITEDSDIFSASLKSLYKCQPETSVKARDAGIILSNVNLIAFNTEKTVAPRSVENCVAEESTSNVGAIVGGIIGGIILICAIVFLYMMYKKKRRFW